jgi:hypothetical protein
MYKLKLRSPEAGQPATHNAAVSVRGVSATLEKFT